MTARKKSAVDAGMRKRSRDATRMAKLLAEGPPALPYPEIHMSATVVAGDFIVAVSARKGSVTFDELKRRAGAVAAGLYRETVADFNNAKVVGGRLVRTKRAPLPARGRRKP